MRVLPAAFGAVMALTSAALALEVTLDGNVFVAPEGSRLYVEDADFVDPDRVQAEVDRLREKTPPAESLQLFLVWRPDEKLGFMALMRVRETLSLVQRRRIDVREGVAFADGVGRVGDDVVMQQFGPGVRIYVVQTGLGHVPIADVFCGSQNGVEACSVLADLPDRYQLVWARQKLDEEDLPRMHASVRKLLEDALPNGYHGMSKP
jgi:hypothetical protein